MPAVHLHDQLWPHGKCFVFLNYKLIQTYTILCILNCYVGTMWNVWRLSLIQELSWIQLKYTFFLSTRYSVCNYFEHALLCKYLQILYNLFHKKHVDFWMWRDLNIAQLLHLFLPFVMWSCSSRLFYHFRTFSRVMCIWHKACLAYQIPLCLLCCLIIVAHFQIHSQKSLLHCCVVQKLHAWGLLSNMRFIMLIYILDLKIKYF
jgi:hypothetical protein